MIPTDVLTLVATSSVLASLVTLGVNSAGTYLVRQRDARFSALYAIFALEEFANICSDTLDAMTSLDYELSVVNGERGLEERFKSVPAMPPYSGEINLRSLGVDASKDILSFQIHAKNARSAASLRWSPYLPDAFAKAKLYTAQLGVEAIELSDKLRARWHLAKFHSVNVVDLKKHLSEQIASFDAERTAIARRTAPID